MTRDGCRVLRNSQRYPQLRGGVRRGLRDYYVSTATPASTGSCHMTTASATDRVALVRAIATQHLADRGRPDAGPPRRGRGARPHRPRGRRDDRRRAQPLGRRRARGGQLLQGLPHRTRPPPHTVALCRGEACQSVGRRGAVRRDPRPGGRPRRRRRGRRGLLPRQLRARPLGHPRRPPPRPAVRASASTRSRRGGVERDPTGSSSPATPPRSRSAPTRWPPPSRRPAPASYATARAGCSGSSRWSRSRPTRAGWASATSTPDRRRRGPRRRREHGIGVVDEHPWLASQQRVSFARVGVVDPPSIADYEAHGGWAGLRRALSLSPAEVVAGGHRRPGSGAAAAPASRPASSGRRSSRPPSDLKFVACNFDEGDSGTFADRMVVEGDPFTLIEGMTIAAHAVGASEGYVYVRSEYPHAVAALRRAIDAAYTHGFLGRDILGCGLDLRPARAGRRRRLHLRRGVLDARQPRGQARRGARQAADPRDQRASGAGRPPSTTCSRCARCR